MLKMGMDRKSSTCSLNEQIFSSKDAETGKIEEVQFLCQKHEYEEGAKYHYGSGKFIDGNPVKRIMAYREEGNSDKVLSSHSINGFRFANPTST